jgi:hypothetical protein
MKYFYCKINFIKNSKKYFNYVLYLRIKINKNGRK